jgi:hypothetical protein
VGRRRRGRPADSRGERPHPTRSWPRRSSTAGYQGKRGEAEAQPQRRRRCRPHRAPPPSPPRGRAHPSRA